MRQEAMELWKSRAMSSPRTKESGSVKKGKENEDLVPVATGRVFTSARAFTGAVGLEAHSESGNSRMKTAGASTVKAAGQGARRPQGGREPAAPKAGDKQGSLGQQPVSLPPLSMPPSPHHSGVPDCLVFSRQLNPKGSSLAVKCTLHLR